MHYSFFSRGQNNFGGTWLVCLVYSTMENNRRESSSSMVTGQQREDEPVLGGL